MSYLSDLMAKVEKQKTLAWLANLQGQGEFGGGGASGSFDDGSVQGNGYALPAQDNQVWFSDLQTQGQYQPPEMGSQSQVRELDNRTPIDPFRPPTEYGPTQSDVREVDNRTMQPYVPQENMPPAVRYPRASQSQVRAVDNAMPIPARSYGASQSQVREVDNSTMPADGGWQQGTVNGIPHARVPMVAESGVPSARTAPAAVQRQPQPAPQMPQERAELQPNSFRNERTGVVTQLSPPPGQMGGQPAAQGGETALQRASLPGDDAEGVIVIQRAVQRDGSTIELIKRPGIDGAGRQTMKTEVRRMVPDALNPMKKAEADYNLKLAQTKAAQGKTPEEEARSERLKILAREQAEREASQVRSPEQRQASAAARLGIKLKPGERIDETTGQVTAAQGSGEWNKQQKEVLAAKEQRDQFVSHTDQMLKNIDLLIGKEGTPQDHPGLRGSTGMIDARLPGFTSDQTNAQVLQKALLAKAAVSGLQDIRRSGTAPGSITEKEWPIFQALNDVLDPLQSEGAYRQSLLDARARLQGAKENVNRNYTTVAGKYSGAGNAQAAPMNDMQKQESIFNARKMIQKNPANAAAIRAKLRAAGIDDSGF